MNLQVLGFGLEKYDQKTHEAIIGGLISKELKLIVFWNGKILQVFFRVRIIDFVS